MITLNRLPGRILQAVFATVLAMAVISPASAGETVTYFHNDVAGSPLLATDVNGLIAWKETYRPYGDRVIQSPASSNNDLWFTGKPHDSSTGLTYMGARYYDPVIGRFMRIDPAAIDFANLHTVNRFTYANNNPYKFVDPDGRFAIFAVVVLIKAIDMAMTAYDLYSAAETGGAAGLAKAAAANAVLSVVPGGKIGGRIGRALVRNGDAAEGAAQTGDRVYRVWGDGAGANGSSWTRTDPSTVDNYRDAAGLPDANSGRFVSEGTLIDSNGVTQREALSLDGNRGGLDEVIVPNPETQILLDRVSGVNKEF